MLSMVSDVLSLYASILIVTSSLLRTQGLYKALYEAPDPADIISQMIHAISNSSTHQLEIERLRAELSQYDEEFQQLKNQDITIRRLEEQLQEFKLNIEDKVAEAVKERSREVEETADGRINEMREVQRGSERRLAAALESLRQAQQSADRAQSQLFEVSSQAESRISGLQAENAILAEGMQRSNMRIAELERSLELLQSSQSQYKSSSQTTSSGNQSAAADTVDQQALQEMLVADLRADCQRKEELLRSLRAKNESMMRDVSLQLSKERESVSQLRQELTERPALEDFLSIKQQLKVLQRLVFNIQDDAEVSKTCRL
jgi:chromosome segregation ATPase